MIINHQSQCRHAGIRLLALLGIMAGMSLADRALAQDAPGVAGSRETFNFNVDWCFHRGDVPGAEQVEFDASAWTRVSCPHTWNDVDTFDDYSRGGHQGETNLWTGAGWYRKEFTLPASQRGRKVFIEFEGVRQVADVYLNGHQLGRDNTGFIPFGFDLTPHLRFGARNVLAVRADNRFDEQYAGDTPWHHPNWHPPHGGIYRNVHLHVTDPLHVTLPLYAHLQTEGVYAWVASLSADRAEVGVSAEIQNEQGVAAGVTVKFSLVDREGRTVAQSSEHATLRAGERRKVSSSMLVGDPHLWEPAYPYVYQVRTELVVNGVIRDVADTAFGLRSFRFDVATGFWINGRALKLHGWGQKPTHAWPGLGAALPDWLRDYTLRQMQDAGGNFLRWGHSAGSATEVECGDKYGFVTIMPGVDGERDCLGQAWATRVAAFRDMIIYFRNHPSICVWEGGNYNVSPQHAAELRKVVETWDPQGGRSFGFRMSVPGMLPSLDLELGTVGRTRALPMLPVVETEYDRAEAPRRLWDHCSPPDFGRAGDNEEQNTYRFDTEQFATNAVAEWWTKFGSVPAHSGGANWIFSDGPHGSRQVTEVARCSGEVDATRLPKEAYRALQAIWRNEPLVHLIGHWNYPTGTVKTVFAVAQADQAELFVNGRTLGLGERLYHYLFAWPNVEYQAGEVRVVASAGDRLIATQTKETAGEATALRLTPVASPAGWQADGSDVVLIDVEVVDAQGRRCPTDQARVDFNISGPGIWRGGYNSGKEGSINQLFLDTECGISRVSVRSTLTPGVVTLSARRAGLRPATLRIESLPVHLTDGLVEDAPAVFPTTLPPRPELNARDLARQIELKTNPPASAGHPEHSRNLFSMFSYTGDGVGGGEVEATPGALAYSDDALLLLGAVPSLLEGARLIRTASKDNTYWANDYIVATAGEPLTLFVAHDPRVSRPAWLNSYEETHEEIMVNGNRLLLYALKLSADDTIRIPGNADQGKARSSALNLILFAVPARLEARTS
jgi:beta-galactosidase